MFLATDGRDDKMHLTSDNYSTNYGPIKIVLLTRWLTIIFSNKISWRTQVDKRNIIITVIISLCYIIFGSFYVT